jgi:F-type H+-transporting ATPase subunit b
MELVKPELGLIFWMALTVLIVLFILKKFAWGPILNAIHEREKSIENSLNLAQQAKAEMEDLKAGNEKLLAEARLERDKILKEAREIKDGMLADAKNKAQAEAERIVADARRNIQAEKLAAVNDLKNQVALISLEIAEKIVRQQLSDDTKQKELVSKLVSEVKLN